MIRVARSPLFLVVIFAVLVGGPLWYASCARTNSALAATSPSPMPMQGQGQPMAPDEVEGAMLLAGLDAKALTAVGLSQQSIAAFVDDFRSSYTIQAPALVQAEARMAAARVASDALRRKIQSGKASEEDVTAYQAQLQELTSATTARETTLAACCATAEGSLSSTQREQLARIRANQHWQLPTEFLLVDRTEAQWVALRDALANEKIAPRYGDEVSPQHASVLGAARSQQDVALAKSRLDTSLVAVQSTLHTAIIE
jgi:hypothetical protein